MRVLLSHSGRDAGFTRRLSEAAAAAGAGLAPWVYWKDIGRNANFVQAINDSLEECGVVLLMWSAEAKKSEWTREEWTAGDAVA